MRKIAIILPFFHIGGVERWSIYVSNALKESGYDINLYVIGEISIKSNFFSNGIQPIKLNYLSLIKLLFSESKPKLIITGLTRLNLFLSILGKLTKIEVITSIHLSLKKKNDELQLKYIFRILIHKIIYKFSTAIICVSEGVKMEFAKINNNKLEKIFIIYNPCFNFNEISKRITTKYINTKKIKFVAAGRLHYQKGFDLLIEAYIHLPQYIIDKSELVIYGKGDELKKISKQIPKFLKNNIKLYGEIENLVSVLTNYDIFILSSRYEGFGNVLVEALAADCFCISFNIEHGPNEILLNGELGILIEANNINMLSSAMHKYGNLILSDIDIRFDDNKRMTHLLNFTPEKFTNDFQIMLQKSKIHL